MHSISAGTLRTWLTEGRQVELLDVSPKDAWAEGAIPGSQHLEAYQALKAHRRVHPARHGNGPFAR